jgi:hypothetical protein
MHLLFINHNGKADKNRPNTLKLLNLINKNILTLKQLDVKMQIYAMTDSQITDNYDILKTYKIKSFPTLIITDTSTKHEIIEGYSDIYNVYNNEFERVNKSNGGSITNSDHVVVDIEDDSNMDGMEYIMSEMSKPDESESNNDVSEAMNQDDIKKGFSKFEGKTKTVTTKYDMSKGGKADITVAPKIELVPSDGNDDAMEEMMMERLMENI